MAENKNRDFLEEARAAAHAAGLPFSENFDEETFEPYVYDGSVSPEDYDLMHRLMEQESAQNRLLVDMDGTLARFRPVDTLETLYEEGYFLNLEPLKNVIEAVRAIVRDHPEIPVYIMSSVLSDSKYALREKNAWLDRYLPEIDMDHRIFPPCGENKLDHVPGGVQETDHLLDDYTHNLMLWEPPAKGIKLLNGINHTRGTWTGNMLRYDQPPRELEEKVLNIVLEKKIIRDYRPVEQQATQEQRKRLEKREDSLLQELVMESNRSYEFGHTRRYLSENSIGALEFLSEKEALRAMVEGIHLCCVSAWKVGEYDKYSSHPDEYELLSVTNEQSIKGLYARDKDSYDPRDPYGEEENPYRFFWKELCVDPAYGNAKELKEAVVEACAWDESVLEYDMITYISEGQRRKLVFLTEQQAVQAIREGIHICRTGSKEVDGWHKGEYQLTELRTEGRVREMYKDKYVTACLSPQYQNPGLLKRSLEAGCVKEKQMKDRAKSSGTLTARGPQL